MGIVRRCVSAFLSHLKPPVSLRAIDLQSLDNASIRHSEKSDTDQSVGSKFIHFGDITIHQLL